MSEQRIPLRDDIDEIDDDRTIVEPRELRHAKKVLFLSAATLLSALVLFLALALRPEGQVMTTSWPNGYRRTRTTFVSAPGPAGRVEHGPHAAWHMDGTRAEEGRYEHGERVGEWRFWNASGELDADTSGWYVAGERVLALD